MSTIAEKIAYMVGEKGGRAFVEFFAKIPQLENIRLCAKVIAVHTRFFKVRGIENLLVFAGNEIKAFQSPYVLKRIRIYILYRVRKNKSPVFLRFDIPRLHFNAMYD